MPQLGRLYLVFQDTSGNARIGSTVNIWREGATVNGVQSGVSPLAVTVRHAGKIATGDTVFINGLTGTTYSATRTSATVITLSGFAGTLVLANGDRLVPSNAQPTIYSDDQGGATVSQPLLSGGNGTVSQWIEFGAYEHTETPVGSLTTTLYQAIIAPTQALGQIRYADEFQVGSATGGIQEALNDLPATGGIVYGPGSARSITSTITMATVGVALMLAPVALTFAIGTKLVISANDVLVIGVGNASLLDFSAETGAVLSIDCTGDRIHLRSFKMACGRIAGCTGSGIQLSTTDTAFIDDVTIDNAGSAGIKTANVTDIHISACRITSSRLSGVFCDSGLTGLWVRDNTLTTCVVDDTAGHSSIAVRGNVSGSALDSDIHIVDNRVFQTKRVGITVNGGSSGSFPTKRVWIRGNHVDQTTTTGEGIACTFNEGAISENRVDKAGVTGILVYGTASKILISDNIVSNSSQGAGSHSAIQLSANNAVGSGLISDITVHGNVAYDDQGSPTQGPVVSIDRGAGGSFARIAVYGNTVDGLTYTESTSTNSIIGYSNLNDDVAVRVFGNSQDFLTQNVTAVVTTLTVIAPTLYLTADNNYTLTAAPTVNDGYDGQLLHIVNVDSADTITIQDQGTLANSNLRLNAATRALGPRDNILLRYSATIGDWVEVAFTNVI